MGGMMRGYIKHLISGIRTVDDFGRKCNKYLIFRSKIEYNIQLLGRYFKDNMICQTAV